MALDSCVGLVDDGCISNDLFREARIRGIELTTVRVVVSGEFTGDPAVSDEVRYRVDIAGHASPQELEHLVSHVDRIAENPNSVRRGTPVTLPDVHVQSARGATDLRSS